MVASVDLLQVEGVVDICPHVVVVFHMMIKALSTSLKLMTRQTTDEAHSFLILLSTELLCGWGVRSVGTLLWQPLTRSSRSSENVSTIIPNTILRPIVVMMIKNDTSYNSRRADTSNIVGTNGTICRGDIITGANSSIPLITSL